MKKLTLLKSLLLVVGLLAGSVGANAQTKTYTLITSNTQLEVGAKYLVVGMKSSTEYYAMGLQNANNRASVSVTVSSNSISTEPATSSTDTKPFEITLGGSTDSWTLYDPLNTGYLYAASSSSNYLKTQSTSTTWKITIATDGKATMTSNSGYTRNILRFNASNNPPLFSCYSSGQNDVYLYKLSTTPTAAATPTFSPAAGTYTSALNVTISSTTSGAKIYYTTDGTDPNNTGNGTLYSSPLSVTSTTTIKAIAYDAAGANPSAVASATYTINAAPTITVTEVSVPNFSTTVGSTQAQTVTVNATNLTADITVALTGTDAAQFSVSPTTITQTGGSVSNATVTITYVPTAPGSHTATLELSSTGATTVTRSLTGTATLAAPTANNATGVTKTGFTANWSAVTGAATYEVNVYTKTVGANATDLFFSEYVEGSSNNKYLEIYNGTGATVDLSNYKIELYANGATSATTTLTLTGNLNNNSTYVIGNSQGTIYTPNITSGVTNFNGDDAIALIKISTGTYVDIFGKIGEDPGTAWTSGSLSTLDQTLVRKATVISGVTTNPTSGFPTLATEWDGYSIDDATHLGSHTMNGSTITPISGSPFTVSAPATSQAVSGLSNLNTYYYTVTAKNGTYSSLVSNETTVGLLSRVANPNEQLNLWSVGNKVYFRAAAGEAVELFNVAGQKIVSRIATDGINEITVSSRGVVFVKAGSRTGKVLIH